MLMFLDGWMQFYTGGLVRWNIPVSLPNVESYSDNNPFPQSLKTGSAN